MDAHTYSSDPVTHLKFLLARVYNRAVADGREAEAEDVRAGIKMVAELEQRHNNALKAVGNALYPGSMD